MKCNDINTCGYIDFKKEKIVRYNNGTPIEESIKLPKISFLENIKEVRDDYVTINSSDRIAKY